MTNADLAPLTAVMTRLLAEDGCPWDRAQTHASLRKHLIEEAYETCDAIDRADSANLCEELGDVLYQIVFHAALAEEEGLFTLQDVIDGVAAKMKRRHPHVYPPKDASAPQDWESIKKAEKKNAHQPQTLPRTMPATLKLSKLTAKLAKRGATPASMAACCDNETERALLAAVLDAEKAGQVFEFTAQGLAQKLEKMLENAQK